MLLTFISSVHNAKVMLGMLVKVFRRDSIATRRRLPREVNVTLENLMGRAPDFDVRAVTIETLTSLRHLLPIAVGIITIIPTVRSVGLSCSHATFCVDDEVGSYPRRAYRNTFISRTRLRRISVQRQFLRPATLDGVVAISNSFLAQCPQKPASSVPSP